MRTAAASAKSETRALVSNCQGKCEHCHVANSNRSNCTHCGKTGHTQDKCWKKFPHLNPHKKNKPSETRSAFLANQSDNDPGAICLIGENPEAPKIGEQNEWLIDSGCSNHMTYNKSLFSTLSKSSVAQVVLGNGNRVNITGCGSISINIQVNGRSTPVILENVFLVPEMGYQLLSVSTLSRRGLSTTFTNGSRKANIQLHPAHSRVPCTNWICPRVIKQNLAPSYQPLSTYGTNDSLTWIRPTSSTWSTKMLSPV